MSSAARRPRRVLLVCHANTSRSVIAEALLRRMLAERGLDAAVEVRSGGIAPYAREGMLVSLDARLALREAGIELPAGAAATDLKLRRELIATADLIVLMTEEQRAMLAAFPEAAGKPVRTLRELAGEHGDVADPAGRGEEAFRRCRDDIQRCLDRALPRLLAEAGVVAEGTPRPTVLRPWERTASEAVYACRIFRLVREGRRSPRTGRAYEFHLLECPDWVNIIPLTAAGEVVMVRQFRHGRGCFSLEVPGGMVDPRDPSPLAAARREMVEETGYDCEEIVHLGTIDPNPAVQNNRCHTFLGRGATRRGEPRPDEREDTEVVLVPLARIPELIRRGEISHALVVVAFHWLELAGGA